MTEPGIKLCQDQITKMRRIYMKNLLIIIITSIAAVVISSLLSGLIAMLLWNWLAVGLFAAPKITIWYGIGIWIALCTIRWMFKGSKSGK